MLVRNPLVPSAGIAAERPHLNRIVGNDHHRSHVVPGAHQANHLRFERSKRKVELAAAIGKQPCLVDTRREKHRSERARPFRKIRHLRPFVLATVQVELRHRGIPVRGIHRRGRKVVTVPVRIFVLLHRRGIVDDIVPDREIDRGIPERSIGTPRVVHVQGTRRIETFPQRADLGIHRRPRRAVHENRIQHREIVAQFHHPLGRHRHVGRIQADKVDGLQRVPRKHRRRHRTIEPAALARVILRKPHHHRIFAQNHLRQRLVTPRALEPHQLGPRRHERLGIAPVGRVGIQPDLGIGTEQRGHLELARLLPLDPVIVVEVLVRRIRVDAYRKRHPLLEIRDVLVPGIAEPAVTLGRRDRRRSFAVKSIVAPAGGTQNMQKITVLGRIVTPRRLDMHRKRRVRRHAQEQNQRIHPNREFHQNSFTLKQTTPA